VGARRRRPEVDHVGLDRGIERDAVDLGQPGGEAAGVGMVPGQPLSVLGTIGAMGMGIPYFVLRYGFGYEGDVVGAGFEYGTAFLLTAGLMNLLLVLDVWDISRGKKE